MFDRSAAVAVVKAAFVPLVVLVEFAAAVA